MSPGSANTTRSGASIPPARTKAYPMSRSMRRPSATSNACVRCARMPRSSSTRRGTQVYSLPVSTKVSGKALREPRMSRFWTSIVVRKIPTSSMDKSFAMDRDAISLSSHLQPLNDGLDAGVGPNGSIERVRERKIDSTDVRRGALQQPLDRRLPVAKPHEGVGDQVFPNVLRLRTLERLP